jgi:hypothetical protein
MARLTPRILGAFAALALAAAPGAGQEDVFNFAFSGPDRLVGAPGAKVRAEYAMALAHEGPSPRGAQGWAFSVALERDPYDSSSVLSVSMDGTDAALAFRDGFMRYELARREAGAVGAVLLSLDGASRLPVDATSTVARLELETPMPDGDGALRLRFQDYLSGSGKPVENVVTHDGSSRRPRLRSKTIERISTSCCEAPLGVGFSAASVSSSEPHAGIAGRGALCLADEGSLSVPARSDADRRVEVHANVISQLPAAGIQAWSLSIALSGDGEVVAAEFPRRCPGPEPFCAPAYERTEAVPAGGEAGMSGAVSAVVLDFDSPAALPARGTESVLRLVVEGRRPARGLAGQAVLAFRDGLIGSGEPVLNRFVVEGAPLDACNLELAALRLEFEFDSRFIRADADGSGRLDIVDPVRTLDALFLGHQQLECRDAADANDDGGVNVADAVYSLGFLFLGSRSPPPPFPGCGDDLGVDDELGCPNHPACGPD